MLEYVSANVCSSLEFGSNNNISLPASASTVIAQAGIAHPVKLVPII